MKKIIRIATWVFCLCLVLSSVCYAGTVKVTDSGGVWYDSRMGENVDCTKHNYRPLSCEQISNLHDFNNYSDEYVCTKCGTINSGFDGNYMRKECSNCKAGKEYLICDVCHDSEHIDKCKCPLCYPDLYTEFFYNDVMRRPDAYLGEPFVLKGKIVDIHLVEKNVVANTYTMNVQYTVDGMTYNNNVSYFAQADIENLLIGDNVSMYGEFAYYDANAMPYFNMYYAQLAS